MFCATCRAMRVARKIAQRKSACRKVIRFHAFSANSSRLIHTSDRCRHPFTRNSECREWRLQFVGKINYFISLLNPFFSFFVFSSLTVEVIICRRVLILAKLLFGQRTLYSATLAIRVFIHYFILPGANILSLLERIPANSHDLCCDSGI